MQVNRQRLARARDLLGALRVTVFSPDDLELVKGGPATRRRYLDDLLVAHSPKLDVLRTDLDRILRQRNALLKQMGGRHGGGEGALATLDVWDERLGTAGTGFVAARRELLDSSSPPCESRTRTSQDRPTSKRRTSSRGPVRLVDALRWRVTTTCGAAVTTVGPHRDELALSIDGRAARTHASQGEQRSLALALRLAGHHVVANEIGAAPVLLLDDVFSELDPTRSAALLAHLPAGQTLLTTAGGLPPGAHPEHGGARAGAGELS